MHNLRQDDFIESSDLSQVTVLALHFPIEAINRENPRKAGFLFKRSRELDILIESYWRGDVRVEPKLYFQQLRLIKARLYGQVV